MEKIIMAFEGERTALRIRELLEGGGTTACLVCRTADQARRAINKLPVPAVVCGYKLGDQAAELSFEDLPPSCAMLVLAHQDRLDLLGNDDIFRLPSPVGHGGLLAAVRLLLQVGRRLERYGRPCHGREDRRLIDQARALLMDCHGIAEEQTHYYLQRKGMDSRTKLAQTARLVLDSKTVEQRRRRGDLTTMVERRAAAVFMERGETRRGENG